jgi:hypothetical protein
VRFHGQLEIPPQHFSWRESSVELQQEELWHISRHSRRAVLREHLGAIDAVSRHPWHRALLPIPDWTAPPASHLRRRVASCGGRPGTSPTAAYGRHSRFGRAGHTQAELPGIGDRERFRAGLVAYLQENWSDAVQAFELASANDTRNLSDDYFLGASYVRLQRFADAARSLEKVIGSQQDLPDDLMRKYVPGSLVMQLAITDRVTASVGFNSIGATLILIELYQQLGRRSEAIGLVQRLRQIAPQDPVVRLSLADLLYDDNDFQGLIEVTDGVENNDDVTLAMLHLKAKALANQGLLAPAAEVLTTCLRRTAGRDPELLKEIRYDRAEAYELLGDTRKAKADWAKLVADDPLYRDARARLEALGT